MEDIRIRLTEDIAKKIIGNSTNAKEYLNRLNMISSVRGIKFKTISSGIRRGEINVANSTQDIWRLVVNSWDYEISKHIIRDIFRKSKKYQSGRDADNAMRILINEWNSLCFGDIAWPFSQGNFDDFVQRINSEQINGFIKDKKVKEAAVKYRRIKEINTVRNDFIETLIFERNDNITPTLNHRRGVDFFVNGISFDQKVARSPTNEFKRKFGDNWRQTAIEYPEIVAEYLYTYQDEGRFGNDPRLLVVYIDENVSVDQIRTIINQTDLTNYITINFTFNHRSTGRRNYRVPCFVILLHNGNS